MNNPGSVLFRRAASAAKSKLHGASLFGALMVTSRGNVAFSRASESETSAALVQSRGQVAADLAAGDAFISQTTVLSQLSRLVPSEWR